MAENGSMRVVGPPWRTATSDSYDLTVLFHRPHVPKGTVAGEQDFRDGLTDAQVAELRAVHEAGHAVLYALAGVTVEEVSLQPGDSRPSGDADPPVGGHTILADPLPTLPYPEFALPLLGGQAAAELWLQRSGLETPWRRLMAQLRASSDHDLLLSTTTARPVAWLYGDVEPPDGWSGTVARVDALLEEARGRLATSWDAVEALTADLVQRGTLGQQQISNLLHGRIQGAPSRAAVIRSQSGGREAHDHGNQGSEDDAMSGGEFPNPAFTVDELASLIRARPDDPFVKRLILLKGYLDVVTSTGAVTLAQQTAAYAQIVATLGAAVTNEPVDGEALPPYGGTFERSALWLAHARALAEAAQGNDVAYLNGIAESVVGGVPSGESGSARGHLERAAINGLSAAGVASNDFKIAVESLAEIAKQDSFEGTGASDWLLPASVLLALSVTGRHQTLRECISRLTAGNGGSADRLTGLFLLPFGLFAMIVAHDASLPTRDDRGIISTLFRTGSLDEAIDANAQRLEFARLLSEYADSFTRLSAAEQAARNANTMERLGSFETTGDPWLPEMLWLLMLATGNWIAQAVENGVGTSAFRARPRPRPVSRRPKRKKR